MKTHNFIQGTTDWHVHRVNHNNASDAPAMMNVSPYVSRSELIHSLSTGQQKPVDKFAQKVFDDGHRFEALARAIAEEIIGEELFPVTGSLGKLSASFDGLTIDDAVNFEHKTLNDALREAMVDGCTGADLPMCYQVQMEQQHAVSGAEKTLFMASIWDNNNQLIEERHCWYQSNLALRKQIMDGWEQLEQDVAAYEPEPEKAALVVKEVSTLPSLRIAVTGGVVSSNLPEYKAFAIKVISGINTDLQTDQDFSDAEADIKFCEKGESELDNVKARAQSQMESIDELYKTIDDLREHLRSKRLTLEKLVKTRKEDIRKKVVQDAAAEFSAFCRGLNEKLGGDFMPDIAADFVLAIKGKRTIASVKGAASDLLAAKKIAAKNIARQIEANLSVAFVQTHGFLFSDLKSICSKPTEDFAALAESRVSAHQKAEQAKADALAEQARERIRAEERRKAEEAAASATVASSQPPSVSDVQPVMVAPVFARKFTSPAPAERAAQLYQADAHQVDRVIRPSNKELLGVIAAHYRITDQLAAEWLSDFSTPF